jgi:DNA polymerase-3 subunit alpha
MNIRTYYSILQSTLSPKEIIKKCKEYGYKELILCDDNLSGVVEFYEECKANEIKPIIGVTIKVCELESSDKGEHNKMYDVILIAKNKSGYKNLIKIVSKSNNSENVLITDYKKIPRVHLDEIKHLLGDLVCIIGQPDSELFELGYKENDQTAIKYILEKYKSYFSDLIEYKDILWSDIRYMEEKNREDFLILLCVMLNCKLVNLHYTLEKYGLNNLTNFIYSDEQLGWDGSLKNKEKFYSNCPITSKTLDDLLSRIEEYNILSKPNVPKFNCPRGLSQNEYLTELCREGWKKRFPVWTDEVKKKEYVDRVKFELSVLQSCELDGYFLVVQDYINWAKERMLVNYGRGSVGGSLVAYLIGITELDPIPFGLLFERFYSADRSAGGIISNPDVDTDFPKYRRQEVIDYISEKYGKNRVNHIITFATLKGAGALTEVLRCHNIFEEKKIKSITKNIPPDHKIADKMEHEKESSIIRYTLKNIPEVLKELGMWENDSINGEYSYYLEQAIRLEGRIKSYGIHASGILLSDLEIDEIAPSIIEANGNNKFCALEMGASEKTGLVKLDILGLETLDVLMDIQKLLLGEEDE